MATRARSTGKVRPHFDHASVIDIRSERAMRDARVKLMTNRLERGVTYDVFFAAFALWAERGDTAVRRPLARQITAILLDAACAANPAADFEARVNAAIAAHKAAKATTASATEA